MMSERSVSAKALSPDGTTGRGGALDALRFLAAFFVVAYHYGDEAPVALDTLHPIFFRGYLATDFFLLLSGYVLGLAYGAAVTERRIQAPEFLTRRLTRIWPAHLVVLAIMAGLFVLASWAGLNPHHPGRFNWADLLPQALLIQSWADIGGGGWNLPTWSLSALIFSYAIFPLLWRSLLRVNPVAGVALATAFVFAVNQLCLSAMGRGLFDLPFHFGVLRALPLFALGASLARLTQARIVPPKLAALVAAASLATLLGLQLFTAKPSDSLSIVLIALIVVATGSASTGKGSRWIQEGGRLSFSLFITHVLAAMVWFGVIHAIDKLPAVWGWISWTASLVFALGVAFAFDRVIDQPIQHWLKPRLATLFAAQRTQAIGVSA